MRSLPGDTRFVWLLFIACSWANSLVSHEKRAIPLPNAAIRERRQIEKHALLPMGIGLKQNQHAELSAEKWIMVSKFELGLRVENG